MSLCIIQSPGNNHAFNCTQRLENTMSNATTTEAVGGNTQPNKESLLPSSRLAPLAEILSKRFHIDVSQNVALIVQTSTGTEFPLSLLSIPEAEEIRDRACDQYVNSVLTGGESIDCDRATLFFISRFCDKNNRLTLQTEPGGVNRPNLHAGRRAVTLSHRIRPILTPAAQACS